MSHSEIIQLIHGVKDSESCGLDGALVQYAEQFNDSTIIYVFSTVLRSCAL